MVTSDPTEISNVLDGYCISVEEKISKNRKDIPEHQITS